MKKQFHHDPFPESPGLNSMLATTNEVSNRVIPEVRDCKILVFIQTLFITLEKVKPFQYFCDLECTGVHLRHLQKRKLYPQQA